MIDVTRRQFVQTASLLLGCGSGSGPLLFGAESRTVPAFTKEPIFEPAGLFLTWQRTHHDDDPSMGGCRARRGRSPDLVREGRDRSLAESAGHRSAIPHD